MGGLLSSIFGPEEAPPTYPRPQPTPRPAQYSQAYQQQQQTSRSSYQTPSNTYRAPSNTYGGTNCRTEPLAPQLFQCAITYNWYTKSTASLPRGVSYQIVQIQPHDSTYTYINNLFRKSAQKHQKVVKIIRVENPFLMGSYLLKKDELISKGLDPKENYYFHGTKESNVLSICENNLDWRLHGDSVGAKFGKGISFSPISNYSSHYCDKADDAVKTMFVVRVLESRSVIGKKSMVLPPPGFDTAIKENGQVVVKFYDNEFYPEYIIYFTGSPIVKNNKGNVCGRTLD